MKKWLYPISVGSMLAVFIFFYFSHLKETEIREKIKAEQVAQQAKAEKERKAAIEAKAREDAEKRAAERAAADAKKEADRIAKWNAEIKKIEDDTAELNAKSDAMNKQASALEIQLNQLRRTKEQLNRDTFDVQKQVEQARVAKRTAEMEIQRMTDMISKRAEDSSLARMPAPAAAKPSS